MGHRDTADHFLCKLAIVPADFAFLGALPPLPPPFRGSLRHLYLGWRRERRRFVERFLCERRPPVAADNAFIAVMTLSNWATKLSRALVESVKRFSSFVGNPVIVSITDNNSPFNFILAFSDKTRWGSVNEFGIGGGVVGYTIAFEC